LRSGADANALRLTLEGLAGQQYSLRVRTPRKLGAASGVKVVETDRLDTQLVIAFEGSGATYVRREISVPLLAKK
jgi:hypothetical protein